MDNDLDQIRLGYKKFIEEIEEFRHSPNLFERQKAFQNIFTPINSTEDSKKTDVQDSMSHNEMKNPLGTIEENYRTLLYDGIDLNKIKKTRL